MLVLWILGFALLGSLGAAAGGALLLAFPARTRRALVPALISYAAGTLLGAAFLGLLPAALSRASGAVVLPTVLAGIVLFFVLEKIVLWRHCHDSRCEAHGQAGPLILIGDAFHNFVDGVVIAAAFLVSIPLGVATALAVIGHEVPQEIGDFAILLDAGYGSARAFALNLLSAAATLPGAVVGCWWLAQISAALPYVLGLSAASFIYIATVDLVPALHRRIGLRESAQQLALLLAGIGTIFVLHQGH